MKKTSLILAISLATMLGACGKKESTPESAAPAVPEAAAPAPAAMEKHDETANQPEELAANDAGKKVFGATCSLCHASGAAGAPIFGNKADWDPRIAQGMDVLYKHAIEGFTGAKGVMPARGGATTLSDDDVKAAVNYMVDKAKNS